MDGMQPLGPALRSQLSTPDLPLIQCPQNMVQCSLAIAEHLERPVSLNGCLAELCVCLPGHSLDGCCLPDWTSGFVCR